MSKIVLRIGMVGVLALMYAGCAEESCTTPNPSHDEGDPFSQACLDDGGSAGIPDNVSSSSPGGSSSTSDESEGSSSASTGAGDTMGSRSPDQRPSSGGEAESGEGNQDSPVNVSDEDCVPKASVAPEPVEFPSTQQGQMSREEVCVFNDGCEALTLQSVSFQTAAVGDVFEYQEQSACQRTGQACIVNNDCGECSVSKDYCSSDIECGTGGNCEYQNDNICEKKYPPLIGASILPKQQDPDARICFDVIYTPFESGQTLSGEENFLVIQTDDPIQPTVNIPITAKAGCVLEYELTHTDEVENGLTYMDFTTVPAGSDPVKKTITVQNTGGNLGCPLTLDSLQFQSASDTQKGGGYFWVIVRRDGSEIGSFGKIGSSDFTPFAMNPGQAFDLDVYFERFSDVAVNPTELTLNLRSDGEQFSRIVSIQAGDGTPRLALGPATNFGGTQAKFWFASDGETVSKTLALYNEGLEPVKLDTITLDAGNGNLPDDFALMDDDECVFDGEFVCDEIPGFGMLSVVVEYTPVSQLASPNAFLYVWTEDDPYTGASGAVSQYSVNLYGNYQYPKIMPYADPVVVGKNTEVDEDGDDVYVGFSTGDTVTLDGSASSVVEDSMTLVEQGYIWWITYKPEGSVAKLNQVGGAQVGFIADAPGFYSVHLVVTGQEDSQFVFSEENWVYIRVD